VFFKQCIGGVFGNLVFANGQNNVVFVFAVVISRDSISLSAYAKYEYLDFARRHK
jgi:hypothetical protein